MNGEHTTIEAREKATCRWCRKQLDGDAYQYGGRAFVPHEPGDNPRAPRREAKSNWYGGFVCSRSCDYRAALDLEQMMPGHGSDQREPGCYRNGVLDQKWGDAR